jgi:hypothetical protein
MNRRNSFGMAAAWAAVVGLCAGAARGQWMSQTVALEPGWNAVHVQVQPEPAEFDAVFAGLPVEGIWVWNKRFSPVEFELDPETPLAPSPHWLTWLPPENPAAFLSQAFRLVAGQSYLIQMRTNAAPQNVTIKGRARAPSLEWFPHSLNLVGFPVHPANPPTFDEFFRPTPKVDTGRGFENELYALDAAGRARTVVAPLRDRVRPGVAYWVKAEGALDYEGPLRVTTDGGGDLDFGSAVQRLGMAVENLSAEKTYVATIAPQASEEPPAGQAELAGPVPLHVLVEGDVAGDSLAWTNLTAQGVTKSLAPGETWHLELGLRRDDLAAYVPTGTNGAAYQSLLRVTDSEQSLQVFVPVSAETETVRRLSRGDAVPGELGDHHADEGLWVGHVALNEVTCPTYSPTNLLPADSGLGFRVLLHVDAYGYVQLLQRVYLAWEGPATNGQFRLYAEESSVPADSPDVKRISSVAFPFMAPAALTNLAAEATGTGLTNRIGTTVALPFDDPTNPFLHAFHPMLDNKDWDFRPYGVDKESRTVERDIALDFGANVFTNGVPEAFYGIHEIGAAYEETLRGLREQDIQVRGYAYLKRVSMVNALE